MKIGSTSIDVVTDGTFLMDGGAVFGQAPKTDWSLQAKPDRQNRVRLGLNCLLVQTDKMNILVDTGAGLKRTEKLKDDYGLNGNKLVKGLKAVGVTGGDIDVVLLTHLHFDHSGGCTKLDSAGNAVPTFPKATYMVQRACWEEAINPNERQNGSLYPEDFMPLEKKGLLTLLDGDTEIAPGVVAKVTSGHSAGHQIVLVECGSERIAFLGDLIPTAYHLPLTRIAAFDQVPNDTLEQKRQLLKMAADGGWLLVFGHGIQHRAGYMEQRNGRATLRPVEM